MDSERSETGKQLSFYKLLKEKDYNYAIPVKNKETKTISASTLFKDNFDLAKLSVNLDSGEEIHFWVIRK